MSNIKKHRVNYRCGISVEVECEEHNRIVRDLDHLVGDKRSNDQLYVRRVLQEIGMNNPEHPMNIWHEKLQEPEWLEQPWELKKTQLEEMIERNAKAHQKIVFEDIIAAKKKFEQMQIEVNPEFPIFPNGAATGDDTQHRVSMELIETLSTRLPNPETYHENFIDIKPNEQSKSTIRFYRNKSTSQMGETAWDWYLMVDKRSIDVKL